MRVLYFGPAAELVGYREEDWEVFGPLSVTDFWKEAVRRHPGLAGIQTQCRIASGGEYVTADGQMDPNQEAAVIPPVSGG